MKRILGNITFALAALLFMAGCAKPELVLPEPEESGEGLITLTLKNGTFPTRGASDLESYESVVKHIDIIMFENGDDGKPGAVAYHFRKSANNLDKQRIALGRKEDFENEPFWIYVIANHDSEDGSVFENIDFTTFCGMTMQDELMFLTGHEKMGDVEFPQHFLMDGVAYDSDYPPSADKTGELDYQPINLRGNSAAAKKDLLLKVDLKRAAAKIKVNIKAQGKDNTEGHEYDNYVQFMSKGSEHDPTEGAKGDVNSGFYFRELPYSTSLIADSRYASIMTAGYEPERRNTVIYNGDRFSYSSDNSQITITAYSYSRDWSSLSGVDAIKKTIIVAHIPLDSYEYGTVHYVNGDDVPWVSASEDNSQYTDGATHPTLKDDLNNPLTYRENFKVKDPTGKETVTTGWFGWSRESLTANYYQIPISETKALKRNGYYELTVVISIPGGSDPGEPVELDPVKYEVYDWTQKTITVGNKTEKPAYLALNKEEFEMYNVEEDYTLEFASSENVTVEVVNYYFEDKLGQRRHRYQVNSDGTTYYDASGNKKDSEDADIFKGETQTRTEDRSTNLTFPADDPQTDQDERMTYTEATANINEYAPLISTNAATLIQNNLKFSGSCNVTVGTGNYRDTGSKGTWRINNRMSYEEIINTLVNTYHLSKEDAETLFDNSNLTYQDNWSWYYGEGYTGSITYPIMEEITENRLISFDDKEEFYTYNEVTAILRQNGITSNNQIQNYVNELYVTGTVTVPYRETIIESVGAVTVEAVPDEGMSGNIKITSSIPENNTIRYIELLVKNDNGTPNDTSDDIERTVTIKQYPLEYITGTQAWYSYRSDFGGTTYEKKGTDRNVTTKTYNYTTDKWTYSPDSSTDFYRSMVAEEISGTGTSNIYEYHWNTDNNGKTANRGYDVISSGVNNARIYNVKITATSADYRLGAPRIDPITKYTDKGADNAEMVSPSFMIASQLGVVYGNAFTDTDFIKGNGTADDDDRTKMAASHCEKYVEVYKVLDENGDVVEDESGNPKTIHLHDWRLPTKAELYIINRFQRTEGSAIDRVLKGRSYYSASGPVDIYNQDLSKYDNIISRNSFGYDSSNQAAIRCIRDAFANPSQDVIPVVDPVANN